MSGWRVSSKGAVVTTFVVALLGCSRKDPPSPAVASLVTTTPSTVVASASASGSAAAPPASANLPTVRFAGRFDASGPKGVRFAWSGSALVTRFAGTSLQVRLKDDNPFGFNAFQVVVDGEPKGTLQLKKNQELYTVVEGLPDGTHDVTLFKRTEAKVGEVTFFGFETPGKLLPPPPPKERRIEILGDSITTGFGNEGPGAACGFDPRQQNEYLTYGAITARELGAEHMTIAWSGKTIGEMTQLMDRTLPGRDDSRWDHKQFEPDLVVINLGTNNFYLTDPGEKKYVEVYVKLATKVRQLHPRAFIVCALGPMLTNIYPEGHNNLTQARKYMHVAVAKLKETDSKLEFVEFPEQNHAHGLGCGFHPSLKTHKLMAERLVALVRERLGW